MWPRRENFRLDINVSIYLLILLFAIMVHNEAFNEDDAKKTEGRFNKKSYDMHTVKLHVILL